MLEAQIDPRINIGAAELIESSKIISKNFPLYLLNYSWPSVSTLALYSAPLFSQNSYSKEELHLLQCTASYLGQMASKCWQQFDPSIEVKLSVNEEKKISSVTIETLSGQDLEEGPYLVNITEALHLAFQSLGKPYPYFLDQSVSTNDRSDIISRFALGLFAGLTPHGKGAWVSHSTKKIEFRILRLTDYFSKSIAKFHKLNFSAELYGKNNNVYHRGMVIPPSGLGEKVAFSRSTRSLTSFIKEKKLSTKKSFFLASTLAKNPDFTIALSGFLVSIAVSPQLTEDDLKKLYFLRSRFCQIASNCHGLIQEIKGALELKESNWLDLLERQQFKQARKIYSIEYSLGVLPLLRLQHHTIEDPKNFELVQAIAKNRANLVLERLDQYANDGRLSVDMALLEAFIRISFEEIPQAKFLLENIEEICLAGDSSNNYLKSKWLELRARIEISQNSLGKAADSLLECVNLEHANLDKNELSDLAMLAQDLLDCLDDEEIAEQSPLIGLKSALIFDNTNIEARTRVAREVLGSAIRQQEVEMLDIQDIRKLYRSNPSNEKVFLLAQLYSLILETPEAEDPPEKN